MIFEWKFSGGVEKQEGIEGVIRQTIDMAPGYYDRGLEEMDAKLRAQADILRAIAAVLTEEQQLKVAAALGWQPEGMKENDA